MVEELRSMTIPGEELGSGELELEGVGVGDGEGRGTPSQ